MYIDPDYFEQQGRMTGELLMIIPQFICVKSANFLLAPRRRLCSLCRTNSTPKRRIIE